MAFFNSSKRSSSIPMLKYAGFLAEALHLGKVWFDNAAKARRDLEELSRMSDRELADIGLCRSDLTFDGLSAAGKKRALQQDIVAVEIAALSKRRKATKHLD
ncbi:MAG: DUF1127 domain-containing protein [Pseudomonadota bacterium]